MPQVPSRRWRVKQVIDLARELSNSVDQKAVMDSVGRLIYNVALSEIATLLNNSSDPSYFTSTPLTVSDNVSDISLVLYDRIVVIEDTQLGECIYKSPVVFSAITNKRIVDTSFDSDILWTQMGNILRFRVGGTIEGKEGNKVMWYHRQPYYPSLWDTDYVDLSDKWIPLLVKRIFTYIVLMNTHDVPKNVYQDMANDYQQLGIFTEAELLNKMEKK